MKNRRPWKPLLPRSSFCKLMWMKYSITFVHCQYSLFLVRCQVYSLRSIQRAADASSKLGRDADAIGLVAGVFVGPMPGLSGLSARTAPNVTSKTKRKQAAERSHAFQRLASLGSSLLARDRACTSDQPRSRSKAEALLRRSSSSRIACTAS